MTYLLHITYRPSAVQARRTPEEKRDHALKINAVPGLLAKIWISDADQGLRGGTYLFAERPDAEAWQAEIKIKRAAQGATEIHADIFEVDDQLSAITGFSARKSL